MVRNRMKKVAKKTHSTWISLANIPWVPEEDVMEDGTHFSKSGTTKVMAEVRAKIKAIAGFDIMSDMEIQDKPYNAIYSKH